MPNRIDLRDLRITPKRIACVVARTQRVDSGCLEWTGHRNHAGYGVVKLPNGSSGGQPVTVHRLMFHVRVRPLSPDEELDHMCRNRACCNVEHLEVVDRPENVRRAGHATRKSRAACGNGHLWTPENTIEARGTRQCRECSREAKRRYRAKAAI